MAQRAHQENTRERTNSRLCNIPAEGFDRLIIFKVERNGASLNRRKIANIGRRTNIFLCVSDHLVATDLLASAVGRPILSSDDMVMFNDRWVTGIDYSDSRGLR
jgi:hypothetical protein